MHKYFFAAKIRQRWLVERAVLPREHPNQEVRTNFLLDSLNIDGQASSIAESCKSSTHAQSSSRGCNFDQGATIRTSKNIFVALRGTCGWFVLFFSVRQEVTYLMTSRLRCLMVIGSASHDL